MAKSRKPRRARGRRRTIPLTPELLEILDQNRTEFIAKLGREPGPGDPIFWDRDADTPQPIPITKIRAEMVVTMIRAELPHVLIYAYLRTDGLLITETTYRRLSAADRKAWDDAVVEYLRAFGQDDR